MIQQNHVRRTSNRRGAALVIALVLMLLVTAISATLIRGFYDDRRERNQSQIRTQAELLRSDFADRTNILCAASPDFTGETLTVTNPNVFEGMFQLTSSITKTPEGIVDTAVSVECYDSTGRLIYSCY